MSEPKAGDYTCRTLTSELAEGQQDVNYTQLIELGKVHKLRLAIRSNAYKFQCSAKVERWDGNRWQQVARIDPMAMETPEGLCYGRRSRGELLQAFEADRETLLDQAQLILVF